MGNLLGNWFLRVCGGGGMVGEDGGRGEGYVKGEWREEDGGCDGLGWDESRWDGIGVVT